MEAYCAGEQSHAAEPCKNGQLQEIDLMRNPRLQATARDAKKNGKDVWATASEKEAIQAQGRLKWNRKQPSTGQPK